MKRILVLLGSMVFGISAYAQLARWVIPPSYDSLAVKIDNNLLSTDSAGTTTLWTLDGKSLFSTREQIQPYKEGVATVIKKDGDLIVGFVDVSGKFISLPNIQIAYDNPSFNDGFLIYRDNDGYGYYQKNGIKASFPRTVVSYPFHQGYAPYLTYAQLEKKKDPHYGYHIANAQPLFYKIYANGEEKDFDPRELSFLSGIAPNGKGVAVIKNKLYWFSTTTGAFEPLLWGDEESEKKRHLILDGDYEQYFLKLPPDGVEIRAKYGKKQIALLNFDKELVPTQFTFDNENVVFEHKISSPIKYATRLSSYGDTNNLGLSMNSKKVLPQQFEAVGLMYGDRAFVKQHGKWGVVEIIPDIAFHLQVNKGEDIAFRHQKFETQIRIDLPAHISAKEARIDIQESIGCTIDKTSRETRDTESGNFVLYNCTLNIPPSLPDTITEITYFPIAVSYDGISMFDMPLKVKAWHLKYYNVDPIDSETTIDNGVASFTININAQRNVGEGDYPFEVKIEADSITVDYEKISETRYKCTIYNLQDGKNNLNIFVTEKGCPSSVFPFEIMYVRPVPKKKTKESVVIRKKSPEPKKEVLTPRLEI